MFHGGQQQKVFAVYLEDYIKLKKEFLFSWKNIHTYDLHNKQLPIAHKGKTDNYSHQNMSIKGL